MNQSRRYKCKNSQALRAERDDRVRERVRERGGRERDRENKGGKKREQESKRAREQEREREMFLEKYHGRFRFNFLFEDPLLRRARAKFSFNYGTILQPSPCNSFSARTRENGILITVKAKVLVSIL